MTVQYIASDCKWTVVQRRSTADNFWVEAKSRGTTDDECDCDIFIRWRAGP